MPPCLTSITLSVAQGLSPGLNPLPSTVSSYSLPSTASHSYGFAVHLSEVPHESTLFDHWHCHHRPSSHNLMPGLLPQTPNWSLCIQPPPPWQVDLQFCCQRNLLKTSLLMSLPAQESIPVPFCLLYQKDALFPGTQSLPSTSFYYIVRYIWFALVWIWFECVPQGLICQNLVPIVRY
jgi:hypothetical protein